MCDANKRDLKGVTPKIEGQNCCSKGRDILTFSPVVSVAGSCVSHDASRLDLPIDPSIILPSSSVECPFKASRRTGIQNICTFGYISNTCSYLNTSIFSDSLSLHRYAHAPRYFQMQLYGEIQHDEWIKWIWEANSKKWQFFVFFALHYVRGRRVLHFISFLGICRLCVVLHW